MELLSFRNIEISPNIFIKGHKKGLGRWGIHLSLKNRIFGLCNRRSVVEPHYRLNPHRKQLKLYWKEIITGSIPVASSVYVYLSENLSLATATPSSLSAVLLLQEEWVWQRLHLSATLCLQRLQCLRPGRTHRHSAVPVATGAAQILQTHQNHQGATQLLSHLLTLRLALLHPHYRWNAQRWRAHHLHAHALWQPGAVDAVARSPRLPAEGDAARSASWILHQHPRHQHRSVTTPSSLTKKEEKKKENSSLTFDLYTHRFPCVPLHTPAPPLTQPLNKNKGWLFVEIPLSRLFAEKMKLTIKSSFLYTLKLYIFMLTQKVIILRFTVD